MISSIKGEHSTLFSQLVVFTWLSTFLTPVLIFIAPLKTPYLQILLVTTLVFTSLGLVGLYKDMEYLQTEGIIDWDPSKVYYLGVIPFPTSFFILGFYLGFRDRAYGLFDIPEDETTDDTENDAVDE